MSIVNLQQLVNNTPNDQELGKIVRELVNSTKNEAIYYIAADAACAEIFKAIKKHPTSVPFRSRHEGYAVLKEEVDELWDDIKADNHANSIKEAIQVAAMALRYVAEFGEVISVGNQLALPLNHTSNEG